MLKPTKQTVLQLTGNPIMDPQEVKVVNLAAIEGTVSAYRGADLPMEERRMLFRRETAREFLGEIRPGMHVFGFSKGQFSLIDLIEELVGQVAGAGEVELTMSTWTVAKADLGRLAELLSSNRIKRVRFIFDFSFQRRQPGLISVVRRRYGGGAIRVCKNHAKFLLVKAGAWRLVVRTSMNLNANPRLEDIDVADDPGLFGFLDEVTREIFEHFDAKKQIQQGVRDHNLEFARL